MSRFFQLLSVICGKLLEAFLQARVKAEMPGYDQRMRHEANHPSDDPRLGGGLPMVGVL